MYYKRQFIHKLKCLCYTLFHARVQMTYQNCQSGNSVVVENSKMWPSIISCVQQIDKEINILYTYSFNMVSVLKSVSGRFYHVYENL